MTATVTETVGTVEYIQNVCNRNGAVLHVIDASQNADISAVIYDIAKGIRSADRHVILLDNFNRISRSVQETIANILDTRFVQYSYGNKRFGCRLPVNTEIIAIAS